MSNALLSFGEASALVAAHAARLRPLGTERVSLADANGRVLAQIVRADRDQPPFSRSTRDGYACRAAEANAHRPLALAGSTRAGETPSSPLPAGSAWEIMTGAPIPDGADAVMMLEHVETPDGRVRLVPPRTVSAGENIVARGAQARIGDELLAPGAAIGFAQIALAASCGCSTVETFLMPRVAILNTGDEIVPVEAEPGPAQIRNSNGPMLAALVRNAGGEPWLLPTAPDNGPAIEAALREASAADLVLISGGVSAGKFDLVEPVMAQLGAQFHFTGVRIQPGKPLVFGEVPSAALDRDEHGSKCFFGLPGNPVSSAVTFLLFAAPVLRALAGQTHREPRFALASLAEDIKGKPGLTRFLPTVCDFAAPPGKLPSARRVEWQGSGDLVALAHSNCFLVLPEDAERLHEGDTVRILLY
ncbi:MAG TPA: gephyrin-like molybdotransferase Glp [Terracidiphilus sp.]|nr:gephyrin-like molybdotransferase Glp [Terracidiphilus sp.]